MNDDLLVKYLAGEADEHERRHVEDWLRDENNAAYFRQLEQIWNGSGALAPPRVPDEEVAWERFKSRMGLPEGPQSRALRDWLPVAAVLALLIVAGGVAEYVGGFWSSRMVSLNSEETVRNVTLSDGSVVTLNRNSELSYPRQFRGSSRTVSLKGEAFFEVETDRDKPFVISVNDVEVEVTGTSFNIKSREEATEVIVETGSVQVRRGDDAVALQPGEKAISTKAGTNLQKAPARNSLYKYYRTNEFICNGTPLQELAEVLGEAYGVQILIPDTTLREQPLTAVFRKEESLDQILKVAGETLELTVRRDGEQIILER